MCRAYLPLIATDFLGAEAHFSYGSFCLPDTLNKAQPEYVQTLCWLKIMGVKIQSIWRAQDWERPF